jgi:hypothetical protein
VIGRRGLVAWWRVRLCRLVVSDVVRKEKDERMLT